MWSRTGRRAAALLLLVAPLALAQPAVAGPPASSGLSVVDAAVTEGNSGSTAVAVTIRMSSPPKKAVSFAWRTADGSATAASDYVSASGSGSIAKGASSTTIVLAVKGDTVVEPDETFEVQLTSVSGAGVVDGIGTVTIRNDDVPPPPDPFGWSPPANALPASGTVVYLESQAGDYVGAGRVYRYTKADSVLAVTTTGGRVTVSVRGDESWSGDLSEGTSGPVATGLLEGLHRYPFSDPGLSWTGEGRGCNTVDGRFIVDSVSYSAGVLSTVTLRFEQHCEGAAPALFGYVRYDANDPTTPPPPGDASTYPWSPPPGAVPATGNYLYLESTPGDWVGQGQTALFTTITVTESSGVVRVRYDGGGAVWWDGSFTGPDAQTQLLPGRYDGLERYPFHNPAKGGLSFSGSGRGCNTLTGSFAADDATYVGGVLQSVTVRFTQYCDGSTSPLRGAFRWSAA